MSMTGQVEVHYPSKSVVSNRPFAIQKLFINRQPVEVVQLVGLSYSLCGQAQKFAANTAFNLLNVEQVSSELEAVMIETLREHFLSLVQMLTKLAIIDQSQQLEFMSGVGRWVKRFNSAENSEQQSAVVGDILMDYEKLVADKNWLSTFAQYDKDEIDTDAGAWSFTLPGLLGELLKKLAVEIEYGHNSEVKRKHLHSLVHESLLDGLNSANWNEWASKPSIDGVATENSAYTRVAKDSDNWNKMVQLEPLKTRLMAKFVDIRRHLQALLYPEANLEQFKQNLFGSLKLAEDERVAWVETARGRLYHFAKSENRHEPVKSYVISAPTEWNFHPKGIAGELIAGLKNKSHEQWKAEVSMIAQIIDPCVPLAFFEEQMHA